MKTLERPVLYLFNNVFYPETIIPLVLSDDVSKKIVRECFEEGKEVVLHSTSEEAKEIATLGKVIMLNEKKEKGEVVAVIQGLSRVKLLTISQHIPYPIYQCRSYPEIKSHGPLKDGAMERLFLIFENWITQHLSDLNDRDTFLKDISSPHKLLNNICLFMVKDVELKIILLECNTLTEKVSLLDSLFIGELKQGEFPIAEDEIMSGQIKAFYKLKYDPIKNQAQ